MKIEIIGRGPITPAQLDEILFGTSTINRKNPLEKAMDKLINEVKRNDEKKYKAPINFNIQSITANHKKNAFTVVWGDGSHTIIHLQPGDVWDDEKALAMCFVKHMMGDTGSFNDIFTTEMPSKIKHIGKVEPIEEKHECKCDASCEDCSCKKETEAEVFTGAALGKMKKAAEKANVAMKKMIGEFIGEPVKVQRYNLFLVDPDGSAKEIYHQGTDDEIHKAMRTYRMKHYPILEANRTPYRVWQKCNSLYVDFGAGSYFMVPGMDHDTFVKGK
jgi:hypothetical protein